MSLIDFSEPKIVFTLKTTPCPPDGLIHLTLNEGSQSVATKCVLVLLYYKVSSESDFD